MTKYLLSAFTSMKSNIFSCQCLPHSVKYSRIFIYPVSNLRNNLVPLTKSLTRKYSFTPSKIQVRHLQNESYQEINTNVANNVILWKFENDKYFRKLKIFLVAHSIIFLAISLITYLNLPTIDAYNNFMEFVKDNCSQLIVFIMPIITVFGGSSVIIFFIKSSLKYIILNKGGETATLVIYHLTKGTIQRVVPVNDIIIKKSREDVGRYASLKLKSGKGLYIIDMEGIYVNPRLFDCTVGALKTT